MLKRWKKILSSKSDYFEGSTVIGSINNISPGYELLSFRIEENADSITLMEPNLYMEGHTVLNIGIKEISTNHIYYIQETVDALNFKEIIDLADLNYNESNLSDEDVRKLEEDYLLLNDEEQEAEVSFSNTITAEDGDMSVTDLSMSTRASTQIDNEIGVMYIDNMETNENKKIPLTDSLHFEKFSLSPDGNYLIGLIYNLHAQVIQYSLVNNNYKVLFESMTVSSIYWTE